MLAPVLLNVGSYLLGSLPQVYLLGRLKGLDLRREPDLHIALWRKGGRALGLLAVLGDFAKGPIPILVGRSLDLGPGAVALGGLLVVLGQMWPAFIRTTGGRGNSTALTMALALAPGAFLWAFIPIGLGAIFRFIEGSPSRSLPLGVGLGFAVLPVASQLTSQPQEYTLAYLGLFLAILLRRLTAGLRAELKASPSRRSLLLNRLLFDRPSPSSPPGQGG